MSTIPSLDSIDYARHREAQERAAAKRAGSISARRVHQQLAQMYAEIAQEMKGLGHFA